MDERRTITHAPNSKPRDFVIVGSSSSSGCADDVLSDLVHARHANDR